MRRKEAADILVGFLVFLGAVMGVVYLVIAATDAPDALGTALRVFAAAAVAFLVVLTWIRGWNSA